MFILKRLIKEKNSLIFESKKENKGVYDLPGKYAKKWLSFVDNLKHACFHSDIIFFKYSLTSE